MSFRHSLRELLPAILCIGMILVGLILFCS